jgi:hypothetical protein
MASVNRFHSLSPREWRLGDKLAWLSTLADPKNSLPNGLALPLQWAAVAQQLRKHFGDDVTDPDRLRVEFAREQSRRMNIFRKWEGEMAALEEGNNRTATRERPKS